MISKFAFSFLSILQNQEIQESVKELARQKKVEGLSQLITILSIALITILFLLALNLFKVYKLKAEIKRLKNQ